MQGRAEAGVTWQSEAMFQEQAGHPIDHVDIPEALNSTAIYAGAVVKGAPHPDAARLWLDFIRSPDGAEDFRKLRLQALQGRMRCRTGTGARRSPEDVNIRPVPSARRAEIDFAPYLVGAGIGVLSWAAFALRNDPLGVTTALVARCGARRGSDFRRRRRARNPYWAPMPFSWDYGVLFLVGLMAGAFAVVAGDGTFRFEVVPHFWRERFGAPSSNDLLAAFSAAR